MAGSFLRGHPIIFTNGNWLYADTGELTKATWMNRPCFACGLKQTAEGHDGCLGTLPKVMNACCGHGNNNEAYIQFSDKIIIDGDKAVIILSKLKSNRRK